MPALADYVVWTDATTGFKMAYPDTWVQVSADDPDTVIKIMAPSIGAAPICEVQAHPDKRFTFLPVKAQDVVQRENVSRDFWMTYLAQYNEYIIDQVADNASLGKGHASFAFARYNKDNGTVRESRRAIMFGSLYYDQLFTIECSSLDDTYDQWHLQFTDIIRSSDFKQAYSTFPQGAYRNFIGDNEITVRSQTSPKGTTQY